MPEKWPLGKKATSWAFDSKPLVERLPAWKPALMNLHPFLGVNCVNFQSGFNQAAQQNTMRNVSFVRRYTRVRDISRQVAVIAFWISSFFKFCWPIAGAFAGKSRLNHGASSKIS